MDSDFCICPNFCLQGSRLAPATDRLLEPRSQNSTKAMFGGGGGGELVIEDCDENPCDKWHLIKDLLSVFSHFNF